MFSTFRRMTAREGLAEGLHDNEVVPFGNPLGEAGPLGAKSMYASSTTMPF
jgi:hypothetical protein